MNSSELPHDTKESLDSGESFNAAEPVAENPASTQTKPDASHTLKVVRFETLARCGDEIWIENDGQIYRLRRTRQGKLILTK